MDNSQRLNSLVVLAACTWAAASTNNHILVAPIYRGKDHFHAGLHCGTPAQLQTLRVSLEAEVTAFPCTGCDGCGPHYPQYDTEASMTFATVQCSSSDECGAHETCSYNHGNPFCTAGKHYAEGSWSGMQVEDFCFMHDRKFVARTEFACYTSSSGNFQREDGTLSLSRTSPNSFATQLSRAGKVSTPAFSLCIRSLEHELDDEAGVLTFGGTDPRLHHSPMVYSTMVGEDHYQVHIRKINLKKGGSTWPLDVPEEKLNEGIAVVEASLKTYFSSDINSSFLSMWKEITGNDFDEQPNYKTYNEIQNLPTIQIQLAGYAGYDSSSPLAARDPDHPNDIVVELAPSQYMEFDEVSKTYVKTFGLKDNSKRSVLGWDLLGGYDVHLDAPNGRVGWAPSDCIRSHQALPAPRTEGVPPQGPSWFGFTLVAMVCIVVLNITGLRKAILPSKPPTTSTRNVDADFEMLSL